MSLFLCHDFDIFCFYSELHDKIFTSQWITLIAKNLPLTRSVLKNDNNQYKYKIDNLLLVHKKFSSFSVKQLVCRMHISTCVFMYSYIMYGMCTCGVYAYWHTIVFAQSLSTKIPVHFDIKSLTHVAVQVSCE